MASDPKWAERRRLSGQARDAAVRRLMDLHREEYSALYREEAEKRGIKPRALTKEIKRARLLAELAKLED